MPPWSMTGWEMTILTFKTKQKWTEQKVLLRQDLQTWYLHKSRKEARLWIPQWNNPSTKNRTESWPQDLLLTHLLESWRTAKMCENRGVLKFNFGFLREQEAPQTPWLQWVLAVLTTELLPGWALFFFPSENANSLQWKHSAGLYHCCGSVREARLFSYPIPWLLTAHPGRICRARELPSSTLTLHPIPTPRVPPCSMAKLLLACKGKQWCNFLLPNLIVFWLRDGVTFYVIVQLLGSQPGINFSPVFTGWLGDAGSGLPAFLLEAGLFPGKWYVNGV